MRREYEGYFTLQYRNLRRRSLRRFRGNPNHPPFLVDELLGKIPKRWRSDARFFLASNLLEMVVVPHDEIEGPDFDLLPGRPGWELMIDDLNRLIHESETVAEKRGRSYVSATSVAIALGKISENLRTRPLQVWEPSDGES